MAGDERRRIYIGAVAKNNDPWRSNKKTDTTCEPERSSRSADNEQAREKGPTLSILQDSEYAGRFYEVNLLVTNGTCTEFDNLKKELIAGGYREDQIRKHHFRGDVQDHGALVNWIDETARAIADSHSLCRSNRHEFVVHISPGTPAMQVAWLIVNSSVPLPFRHHEVSMIQSFPPDVCKTTGKKRFEKIDFIVDTFYRRACTKVSVRERDASDYLRPRNPSEYRSPVMRECLHQLEFCRMLGDPFLILGERGVGKTYLVKKHIFQLDGASRGEGVILDCGRFPDPENARHEILGTGEKAYTGCIERAGAVEEAGRGWLFLDEIHNLSKNVQAIVMNVHDEKSYRRAGEQQLRHCDFHLVCGSNKSLIELVQGDYLMEDFFDRLAGSVVLVPRLKDRREDLGMHWKDVFSGILASWLERNPEWQGIPPDALTQANEMIVHSLERMHLPGNFRELRFLARRILQYSMKPSRKELLLTDEAVDQALNETMETFEVRGMYPRGSTPDSPMVSAYDNFITEFWKRQQHDPVTAKTGLVKWIRSRGLERACMMLERETGQRPSPRSYGDLKRLLGHDSETVKKYLEQLLDVGESEE